MAAYLTGIFPRSEELIAATRAFDRRRVGKEEVDEALSTDVDDLVALQVKANLTHVGNGLLNWQDIFRPLVESWEGLTLGGLTRWFDNNTFYRQPIISSTPEPSPVPMEYLHQNHLPEGYPKVAALPGLYTFFDLSEDRHFRQPEEAIAGLAGCLAVEVESLKSQGFDLVQFQEPSLVVDPPDRDILSAVIQGYQQIASGFAPRSAVQLYFAPSGPILRDLLDLPVDAVGLDLYEEDLELLSQVAFDKGLVCGCVDARNSLMETPEEVATLVSHVREALSAKSLALSSNSGLELLPRGVAEEKVRVLGQARSLLGEI